MSFINSITINKVHWFLDLFNELGITVWIDGGWGVDALLGECTREHQDLDIMISWEDSAILGVKLLDGQSKDQDKHIGG